MMQVSDLQHMLGVYLFDGAGDVVGLILFGVALYLVLMVTRDTMTMCVLMIPVMLICSLMGLISATVLFLMIIAMVILIALNASGALFGGE